MHYNRRTSLPMNKMKMKNGITTQRNNRITPVTGSKPTTAKLTKKHGRPSRLRTAPQTAKRIPKKKVRGKSSSQPYLKPKKDPDSKKKKRKTRSYRAKSKKHVIQKIQLYVPERAI